MGPLQLTVTWYRIRHMCWTVSCILGHRKQSDFTVKLELSLFRMSQCIAFSPAWWILYHVTITVSKIMIIEAYEKCSHTWSECSKKEAGIV